MSTITISRSARLQPYLFFNGRCEEAIEFYRRTVGAELVMLARYKDSPDTGMCPPGSGDKVMHATLTIGGGTMLLSDGYCSGQLNFQGFSLALAVPTDAEAEAAFAALAEGGQVRMPIAKTFFASRFGILTDRFGVTWKVLAAP
jgi:PhnB protein